MKKYKKGHHSMTGKVSGLWAIKGKRTCPFFLIWFSSRSFSRRQTLNSFSPSKLKNLPKLHLDRKGWDCSCWQQFTFKASHNMKLHPKNYIPLSNLNLMHQIFRKCYTSTRFSLGRKQFPGTLILLTLIYMLKFNALCISPHSIRKFSFHKIITFHHVWSTKTMCT